MRRYMFLLLIVLVLAVDFVTLQPSNAQACIDHDQTLFVSAETGLRSETSFVTSPGCAYKVEISGTYKYKSASENNADAFYRSEPACDPAQYDADHCFVWDFTKSTGGWGPILGSPARAIWEEGVGWKQNQFFAASFYQSWMNINRPMAGVNYGVRLELDVHLLRGAGGGSPELPGFPALSAPNYDGIWIASSGGGLITKYSGNIRLGSRLGNNFGSPGNPRGEMTVRGLKIWYDGSNGNFGPQPVNWFSHENLIFEPTLGTPESLAIPARDPAGEYEFFTPGSGEKFRFRIADDNYSDGNAGGITIRVYAAEEAPPRVFRRPLEFDDVNPSYDWWDSNGRPDPAGQHCEAVQKWIADGLCISEQNRIALNHVPNTLVQSSSNSFAPVHAVLGGIVIERRSLLPFDCYDMTIYSAAEPYDGKNCLIEIPNWASANGQAIFIESTISTIYILRVKHDDNSEMRYLVSNPRAAQGQNIRDGCVLGETIPTSIYSSISKLYQMFSEPYLQSAANAFEINRFFADAINTVGPSPHGITIMGYRSEAQENIEFLGPPFTSYEQVVLTDYSSPANSCDTTANFSDCVSINPQFFNEGEYWLSANPAVPAMWTNPGAILEPGAKIILPNLPLDPGTAYGASAQVAQLMENPYGNGRIKISVGQSEYTNSVFGAATTIKLESQTHTPNNGVIYDISIENVGENDLQVLYFCLTEGAAQTVKNCLLDNYSFDMGLTGWDTSGGIVSAGVPGSVELEHGENISQPITLFPKESGPHEYTIEIEATIPRISGGEITMSWDGIAAGIIHVAGLIGFGSETQTFTRKITVAAFDTQPLIVTAYLPTMTADPPISGAIKIHRVCILGPYPQQGGGGVEITPPEGCSALAYPSGGDVQAVLQWHWYQIDRFNRCVFMPKLNEVYKTLTKGFNDLNNQFKFWRQVLYSASAWAQNSLFPWIAGYLSNITPGMIYVGSDGECNDLFCFLTGLVEMVVAPIIQLITETIGQATNLFFSVVSGLLSLFITMIGQVFALLLSVLRIFFGLIGQFAAAEPIPLPGLPNCNATPTEGICAVWWIMENTVLSGPGAAIIPLIVSILYIEYALWVIREIKSIIIRSTEAL